MSDYCVVVADAARARLFTLEPAGSPEVEGGPNLVERNDLVNPEQRLRDSERWSDLKTGRNRAPAGGQAHGYDDHRERHMDEWRRRFARGVAHEAAALVERGKARHLIVVAPKRMLGLLRAELSTALKNQCSVQALAKDLSKLAPQDLHEHLTKEGLVPARRVPAV